jgi:hypothetical protein
MIKRSKPEEGLTKDELGIAQHLLRVYTRSNDLADQVDPLWRRNDRLANHLDSMRREAHTAFFMLVGRLPHKVMMAELNTENPAAWTKLPWQKRSD